MMKVELLLSANLVLLFLCEKGGKQDGINKERANRVPE